ncbi:MAG TPA: hypothetical protein GX735_03165 [Firmicutes bacterium]|nr:hypothetical protein [Bacillota bacterium]
MGVIEDSTSTGRLSFSFYFPALSGADGIFFARTGKKAGLELKGCEKVNITFGHLEKDFYRPVVNIYLNGRGKIFWLMTVFGEYNIYWQA